MILLARVIGYLVPDIQNDAVHGIIAATMTRDTTQHTGTESPIFNLSWSGWQSLKVCLVPTIHQSSVTPETR